MNGERRQMSETNGQTPKLNEALAKAQAAFPDIHKEANNPYFKSKYMPLGYLFKMHRPGLTNEGLAVIHTLATEEDILTVRGLLLHKSGESIVSEYGINLSELRVKDKNGNTKVSEQTKGSAITYGRRYTYEALIGVAATEDDDGNEASKDKPQPKMVSAESANKMIAMGEEIGIDTPTMIAAATKGTQAKNMAGLTHDEFKGAMERFQNHYDLAIKAIALAAAKKVERQEVAE